MASDAFDGDINVNTSHEPGACVLLDRKDNKVSKLDHEKFKQAFKDANIDELTDAQLSKIHKFEANLIAGAQKQDNGRTIELIATKKVELDDVDAALLSTELIRLFGQLQGTMSVLSGNENNGAATQGAKDEEDDDKDDDKDEDDDGYVVNGRRITWKNIHSVKFKASKKNKKKKYNQGKMNDLRVKDKENDQKEIEDKDLTKKSYKKELNQAKVETTGAAVGLAGAGVGFGLAEAGTVAAMAFGGGAIVLGVATVVAVASWWDYSSKSDEENRKHKAKLKYNDQVAIYERRVKKYNQIAVEFRTKNDKLKEYEAKLNDSELLNYANRIKKLVDDPKKGGDVKKRVIMAIGLTGNGKSVVCNRLFGDKSSIEEISGNDKTLFKVAKQFQSESQTSKMKMLTSDVTISEKMKLDNLNFQKYKSNDINFQLYVTDTVGAADSNDTDELNENAMVEFCNSIGGVNAFLVFFKFGNYVDATYKTLLSKYHKIWGDRFWEYCIIVITKCEKPVNMPKAEFEEAVKGAVSLIENELNKISDNQFGEKPEEKSELFTFGEGNFKGSVLKLLLNVEKHYDTKYQPVRNQTPMDELWYDMNDISHKLDAAAKNVNDCLKEMNRLRKIFEKK